MLVATTTLRLVYISQLVQPAPRLCTVQTLQMAEFWLHLYSTGENRTMVSIIYTVIGLNTKNNTPKMHFGTHSIFNGN